MKGREGEKAPIKGITCWHSSTRASLHFINFGSIVILLLGEPSGKGSKTDVGENLSHSSDSSLPCCLRFKLTYIERISHGMECPFKAEYCPLYSKAPLLKLDVWGGISQGIPLID